MGIVARDLPTGTVTFLFTDIEGSTRLWEQHRQVMAGVLARHDAIMRQTIAALKEMDVDYVIPLHCSGEVFYDIAQSEMPNKLLRSYTGTRFVFEAAQPAPPSPNDRF